jgi:hypothetical protein
VSSSGGRLADTSVSTDRYGKAETILTLGPKAGRNSVRVTLNVWDARISQIVEVSPLIFVAKGLKPITHLFERPSSYYPNIWRKFRGDNLPDAIERTTPDLVDYSYAGYKNGEEGIPDSFGFPIYDVTDYGATPNDGRSDTTAIKAAISAAGSNAIVYFPPGQYDVILNDDQTQPIYIRGDNIIIRGSGAQGADRGGTTIKQHGELVERNPLFSAPRLGDDHNNATNVVGSFPFGTKYVDVADTSHLLDAKFIVINAPGLLGDDWSTYVSRPINAMRDHYLIRTYAFPLIRG